jgi:hypothetical protein
MHWVEKVNYWLTFLLGAVVAGEALALLIGMNLTGQSEWARIKNNGLALVDLVTIFKKRGRHVNAHQVKNKSLLAAGRSTLNRRAQSPTPPRGLPIVSGRRVWLLAGWFSTRRQWREYP